MFRLVAALIAELRNALADRRDLHLAMSAGQPENGKIARWFRNAGSGH